MDEDLLKIIRKMEAAGESPESIASVVQLYESSGKSPESIAPSEEVNEIEELGITPTSNIDDSTPKGDLAEVEDGDSKSASAITPSSSESTKDNPELLLELNNPELYNRKRELEGLVSGQSLMEVSPEKQELEELNNKLEGLKNTKTKSFRKIRQGNLEDVQSQMFELEQKADRISKNSDKYSFEDIINSDGTYEYLKNKQLSILEDIESENQLIKKITSDEVLGIGIFGKEVVNLSEDVEERILSKIQDDPKLRSKIEYGINDNTVLTLDERENLIKQSKQEIFSEKLTSIKSEFEDVTKKIANLKDTDIITKERLNLRQQELIDEKDAVIAETGYDIVNREFKDVFKRTTEQKEYDESLKDNKTLDVISTFANGMIDTVLDGVVGFSGAILSKGDSFTDNNKYSYFDAVLDISNQISNPKLLPNSKQSSGNLVNQDGEFNLTGYSIAKTGAEALPFSLALIAEAKKGNVKKAYTTLGKVFNPKKSNQLAQSFQMAEKAYKLTLNENIKEAKNLGLDGADAQILGNGLSLATGLSQLVMPDVNFFKTGSGKAILNTFAGDLKKSVSKEASKTAFKSFLGNIAKEVGEEELEGALSEVLKLGMVTDYNSEFLTKKYQKELVGGAIIVSGALGGSGLKSNIEATKIKLYNQLTTEAEGVLNEFDNLIGTENDPEVIEILKEAKNNTSDIIEAVSKSPKSVTGKQIDLLIKKKKIVTEMKNMDDSFHPSYKEQIEKINEEIRNANENTKAETEAISEPSFNNKQTIEETVEEQTENTQEEVNESKQESLQTEAVIEEESGDSEQKGSNTGNDGDVQFNDEFDINKELDKFIKPVLDGFRPMISISEKTEKLKQIKNKMKSLEKEGVLTPTQSKSLINRALKVDPTKDKQVESFLDYFSKQVNKANLREMKVKYGSRLRKKVKKALKKYKNTYGSKAENLVKLSRIKPDDIPTERLSEYYDVMESFAGNKDLDFDKLNSLYRELAPEIEKSVFKQQELKEAKKLESLNKEDINSDALNELKGFKKAVSSKNLSGFTEKENKIITDFLNIPDSYLETLKTSKIKTAIRQLDAVNNYDLLPNKKLNDLVMGYKAYQTSKELDSTIGDRIIKVTSGIGNNISDIIKKGRDQDSETMFKRLSNVMLQHIDYAIKNTKGTQFYNNIIHPITSGLQVAVEDTSKTQSELEKLIRKTKRKGFELNVITQLYLRQREYEANPEFRDNKVFSVKDHMEAFNSERAKLTYSDKDVELINSIYDEFKNEDGELNSEKLYDSLNDAEKNIIKFIKSTISEAEQFRKHSDDHNIGKTLVYLNDYFPRVGNITSSKPEDKITDKIIGATSTKSSSANSRKLSKANALDFNTFGNFMTYVKESNVEKNVQEDFKVVGRILSELKKSNNSSTVKLAQTLEKVVKGVIETEKNKNIYIPSSVPKKIIKTLLSRTFNKVLMSNLRMVYDIVSNYIPIGIMNIDRLGEIKKASKFMKDEHMNLLNDYNSVHKERLGGSRAIDFQEGLGSEISLNKFNKSSLSFSDKLLDLLNKNKLSDIGDAYSTRYYKIVDAPSKHLWRYEFVNNFKTITGEDIDFNLYKTDPDYKIKFDKAIKQSITKADKSISNLFNTGSRYEQKLKVASDRNNLLQKIDSFMKSFTFNENKVFWDSLNSMFGNGTMNKKEAFKNFMIVNTRSIGYAYLSQTLFMTVMNALGVMEKSEDEDEKAIKRAFAQHGQLILLGNKGGLFNMMGALIFERMREELMKSDGEKYNSYEDSLLFAPSKRGGISQYMGMAGAEGALVKTFYDFGDMSMTLGAKWLKGEEITDKEYAKMKTLQKSMSMLSQITGLPIDRLGKQMQKLINEEQGLYKKKK